MKTTKARKSVFRIAKGYTAGNISTLILYLLMLQAYKAGVRAERLRNKA